MVNNVVGKKIYIKVQVPNYHGYWYDTISNELIKKKTKVIVCIE